MNHTGLNYNYQMMQTHSIHYYIYKLKTNVHFLFTKVNELCAGNKYYYNVNFDFYIKNLFKFVLLSLKFGSATARYRNHVIYW